MADASANAAYAHLLHDVLGADFKTAKPGGSWQIFAIFEPGGACVAGLEVGLLPLILEDVEHVAGTIRSVATAPDWRGLGLFRQLMEAALDRASAQAHAISMLYTETPALYAGFGFQPVPQHAFVGPVVKQDGLTQRRRISLQNNQDRDLLSRLLARRTATSSRCALLVDAPTFLANIARDEAWELVYDENEDVLVVFEQNRDELIIADVVAARMPTFETVIRTINYRGGRAKCLFAPDRFEWHGTPHKEDTGLMIRGPLPPAMAEPFMFPPTSEF